MVDELQPTLPHLLAFASSAPTLEERRRLLSASKMIDIERREELLSRLADAAGIADQLSQASELRLESLLEGTDLDEDQREAALELWRKALTVGAALTMPLMLSMEVLRGAIASSVEQHGARVPETELEELDRELLMVSEAMPAAAIIAAALYADAYTLRCELGISQNPYISITRMLLRGMNSLEDVEGALGEGPCAGIVRYWLREVREFTADHVGVIHALLVDLHKRCYRKVYVEVEEVGGKRARRRRRR